eukprot:758059-Hanusia_phi.AAC.1
MPSRPRHIERRGGGAWQCLPVALGASHRAPCRLGMKERCLAHSAGCSLRRVGLFSAWRRSCTCYSCSLLQAGMISACGHGHRA